MPRASEVTLEELAEAVVRGAAAAGVLPSLGKASESKAWPDAAEKEPEAEKAMRECAQAQTIKRQSCELKDLRIQLADAAEARGARRNRILEVLKKYDALHFKCVGTGLLATASDGEKANARNEKAHRRWEKARERLLALACGGGDEGDP